MTAAIYAGRKALSTAIFESKSVGGYLSLAPFVENYPGVEKVTGIELAMRMEKQLESFGISITYDAVVGVTKTNDCFKIKSTKGECEAKAVILTTGCDYAKIGVPGEKELLGKGVSYCATCDGPMFSGKRIAVIGGGNTAISAAIMMEDIASEVYVINRRKELRADETLQKRLKKANLMLCRRPTRIIGEKFVSGIELEGCDTKEKTMLEVDGIFVNIGATPTSEIAKSLGAKTDSRGHILTECNGATNVPGLFAAGDVTGGIRQIIVAAGQGAMAATGAHDYVRYGKSVSEE